MKHVNNLIWIDLEMTGLDPAYDVILEIASVVTDGSLTVLAEGPHLVIHQPKEVLDAMNDWCKKQHALSGLTQAVRDSTVTLLEAEEQTLAFIKEFCIQEKGILCGNTVWQDRNFLSRSMPRIVDYLHYKLIDVTTVQQLIKRWYPKMPSREFKKEDAHRALDDIYESIHELQHYRKYFFID